MLNAFFSRIILIFVSLLYPAYASFRAVRNRNIEDHTNWMIYWMILAPLICVQQLTDSVFFWFPCYYDLKVAIVLYLLPIRLNGSASLYYKMVQPMLEHNEHNEFSTNLKRIGEQGAYSILDFFTYIADGVLSLVTDAVQRNWLHDKKVQIAKSVPAMARSILPESVRMLMNELDHDFGLSGIWQETENTNASPINAGNLEPKLYEKPTLTRGRSRERRIHNPQTVYTQTNKENIPYVSAQSSMMRGVQHQTIHTLPLQQQPQLQHRCILKEHNNGYHTPNVLPAKISPLKLLNKQLSCMLNEATKFNQAQSPAPANNHMTTLHKSATSVAPPLLSRVHSSTSKGNRDGPTVSRQCNVCTALNKNSNNNNSSSYIRPAQYREQNGSISSRSSPYGGERYYSNRNDSCVLGNSGPSKSRTSTLSSSQTNRKTMPHTASICKDIDESQTERLIEYLHNLNESAEKPILSVPKTSVTVATAMPSRDRSTERRDRSLYKTRDRYANIAQRSWRSSVLKEMQTQTYAPATRHPLLAKDKEKRTPSPARPNVRNAYLGRQRTLRA